MAEPRQTQITVSGAPEGFNGLLSVGQYGTWAVRVTEIRYNLNIASREGESRTGRAFYPQMSSFSSFSMSLVFSSWAERNDFNRWIRGYMVAVDQNQLINGSMTVSVPARRFLRSGIPRGPLSYDDRMGQVSFTSEIDFVGATDPVSAIGQDYVLEDSYFSQTNEASAPFYPAGFQASGAGSLEGTLFDPTPSVPGGYGDWNWGEPIPGVPGTWEIDPQGGGETWLP